MKAGQHREMITFIRFRSVQEKKWQSSGLVISPERKNNNNSLQSTHIPFINICANKILNHAKILHSSSSSHQREQNPSLCVKPNPDHNTIGTIKDSNIRITHYEPYSFISGKSEIARDESLQSSGNLNRVALYRTNEYDTDVHIEGFS